jgi:predicted nucleic acid-binding protein
MVFADTSALYVLLDRSDREHARVAAAWKDLLLKRTGLLTTNYVLLETSALLQRRIGDAAIRAFHEDVVPVLTVDWVDEHRHDAGVQAVLAAGRRHLSLVDCISFQTMRAHGLRSAFSLDSHFREQGFRLLP